MENNDVFRRIRYILDLSDIKLVKIFALVKQKVEVDELKLWLKKPEDEERVALDDTHLAAFLNGLIIFRRGAKDGEPPVAETVLNHNIVFRKLKIAFDLKAEEILEILELADFRLSKHELSAFFRKPEHKHYRKCKDQVMRNFLSGLQIKIRKSVPTGVGAVWRDKN